MITMKSRQLSIVPEPRIPGKLLTNEKHAVVVTSGGSFSSMQKVFARILGMHYSPDSKFMQYEEFLARSGSIKTDLLFLRSTKLFPQMLNRLKTAIDTFKENNPDSQVVVTLIDDHLAPEFKKMKVDKIEAGWTDEYELLRKLALS